MNDLAEGGVLGKQSNHDLVKSGVLGILSNVITNGLQLYNDKKIQSSNQDFQRELISDEREYESPAAQMRRMRDAGLNPQGGLSLDSPSYSAPVSSQPTNLQPLDNSLGFAVDAISSEYENRNVETRTQEILKQSDVALEKLQRESDRIQQELDANPKRMEELQARIDEVRQRIVTGEWEQFKNEQKKAFYQEVTKLRAVNGKKGKLKSMFTNSDGHFDKDAFDKFVNETNWDNPEETGKLFAKLMVDMNIGDEKIVFGMFSILNQVESTYYENQARIDAHSLVQYQRDIIKYTADFLKTHPDLVPPGYSTEKWIDVMTSLFGRMIGSDGSKGGIISSLSGDDDITPIEHLLYRMHSSQDKHPNLFKSDFPVYLAKWKRMVRDKYHRDPTENEINEFYADFGMKR